MHGTYEGGGRLVQVKQPLTLRFVPLREAVKAPPLMEGATISRKRALTAHACFACAHEMPDDATAGS
eukprot:6742283-Prymnesium_polylepis.1